MYVNYLCTCIVYQTWGSILWNRSDIYIGEKKIQALANFF